MDFSERDSALKKYSSNDKNVNIKRLAKCREPFLYSAFDF